MLSFLKYGVVFSFLFSVISLSILVIKTFFFGKKVLYAEPRGDGKKGILYAFGRGMMPWEKESARKHLPTYIGGMLYHTGIFVALIYLFFQIFHSGLSRPVVFLLRLLMSLGILSGLVLLFKRILLQTMRKISCPDDFFSNILVNLFLICAIVHTFVAQTASLFFLMSTVMFLYIPVGKIRHCFFFFYVRILFGLFYGRRNILPPKIHKV